MNVNSVLVERLATELVKRDATITIAESCTGGWIAKTLTDMPGSSAWFEYGFVSYGNNAKADLLQVDASLLAEQGAVSEAVANEMVMGAMQRSGAAYGLAVTGIAGPEGGIEEKPVGTVWFAWAQQEQPATLDCRQFEGDRDTVRRQTVSAALTGMLDFMDRHG